MKNYQLGFIDENTQMDPSSMLYKDANVIHSVICRNAIVGDFSRIHNSRLDEFSKIDRNNLIQNSTIGRLTYTGNFSVVQSSEVGSFCSISWGVTIGGGEHDTYMISTHDFLYNDRYNFNLPINSNYDRYSQRCIIGNDVWIGANATVLRGSKIGHGAVIGANSIVTKDVPDYAIAVGNPAKIIKYRFDTNTIERLLKLKWWNMEMEALRKNISIFLLKDINVVISKLENL